MKRDVFSIAFLGLLAVGLSAPAADTPEPDPVQATLVAERVGEGAAARVRAGVHFRMEPGWHIYWQNPGEAGLSTLVELESSAGPAFGAVAWPAPIRFGQPGGIAGYGYENEVVLAALGEDVVTGPEAVLNASASWLACKARCIQGSARLESTLAEALDAGAELRAWKGFGDSLPRSPSPERLQVHTTAGPTPGTRTVWLSWGEAPQRAEFFPAPAESLEVTPAGLRSRGSTSRVDLEMTLVDGAREWPEVLPAVLVAYFADGRREVFEIEIPLN